MVTEAISGAKITPPKEAFTAGDAMVNFTCAAAAGTVSSMVWSKDLKQLVASERVLINGSRLMFKKLQKEDRGEYTCRLANGINSETATYKLIIFCKSAGRQGNQGEGKVPICMFRGGGVWGGGL